MERSIKHFQKLLDEFDSAAQTYGWEIDQGGGKAVDNAIEDHKKARIKLEKYIMRKIKGEKAKFKNILLKYKNGLDDDRADEWYGTKFEIFGWVLDELLAKIGFPQDGEE